MDPDVTIIFLGNTGVGKSASANNIIGRRVFPSKASFHPVTKQISEQTEHVFGKHIRVVDTPGILGSEELIKTFCQDLPQPFMQLLFLVVVRVDRFSEEDQQAVEAAVSIIGDQNFRKAYLLFTCGDTLKNRMLGDVLHENSSLQTVVEKFEGRYHLFNNQHGGQEQAEELLLNFLQPAVPVVPQEERRIVLIGQLGGGKSSAGNTILGSERFKTGCDFDLVSTETVSERAEVERRRVTVVDTPGFTDEALTPEQLYLQIMRSLVEASPGPHAFVVVVRISKMSAADIKLFELLPTLFGSDASKYIMVLFTHGDKLRGQSMDDLIWSNRAVSEFVSRCGGRFCVFDNTKRGNRRQVREFLRRVDDMVEANGGGHCTSDMFKPNLTQKERILNLLKPIQFLFDVLIAGYVSVKAGVGCGLLGGLVGLLAGVKRHKVVGGLVIVLLGGAVYKLTSDK
ncbi:GTPase IMAP family member 8-like [Pundamilia nyererei]|uniref:GTPase IMAP family member 8 n=1 Tax=Pundamilia nyererei TaxID=303518 RepID=A0A9Y3VW44_9CICH|nr:PREDICTED: GTPase IMAP family member 8-like [Pundamilia nyererei]